jgi:hypothetical protein
VLVVLNLSPSALAHFEFMDDRITGNYRNIFNNLIIDLDRMKPLALQAWDYQVLEK